MYDDIKVLHPPMSEEHEVRTKVSLGEVLRTTRIWFSK
jgi:hypothetical protein